MPPANFEDIQRALVAAAWGIGVLVVGGILLGLIGWVFEVSTKSIFGIWGGLIVIAGASATAWVVWRRVRSSTDPLRRNPLSGLVIRPPSSNNMDPAPPISPVAPPPTELTPSQKKQKFDSELAAGRLESAERIIQSLQAIPGQEQWCKNAHSRIAFKRERLR